jgi:hypothetical protein
MQKVHPKLKSNLSRSYPQVDSKRIKFKTNPDVSIDNLTILRILTGNEILLGCNGTCASPKKFKIEIVLDQLHFGQFESILRIE